MPNYKRVNPIPAKKSLDVGIRSVLSDDGLSTYLVLGTGEIQHIPLVEPAFVILDGEAAASTLTNDQDGGDAVDPVTYVRDINGGTA